MDVLNFISWIKNGQQVTTVDPTQTLLPLGLKDPRRDDGYRSGAITAQDFIDQVVTCVPVPPSLIGNCNLNATSVRLGSGNIIQTGNAQTAFGIGNSICSIYNSTYSNTIGGGSYNVSGGNTSTIAGGAFNYAYGSGATISGGQQNTVGPTSFYGMIAGGYNNCVSGSGSNISGGCNNTAAFDGSSVLGGTFNSSAGNWSTVTGGSFNTVATCYSVVNGGCCNIACSSGCRTAILGGHFNQATCTDSFVVGSCITTNRVCTAFVNNLSIMNIPTSSAGLPSKAVWSNAGVLTIVP